jgi:hypothetical protein
VMWHGNPEGKPIPSEVWAERGVVYARVFEEEPVYIGSTDKRCARRILSHVAGIGKSIKPIAVAYRDWAEGKQITIVAHKPPDMKFLRCMIPTHRAVEAALIEMFRPQSPDSGPWFVGKA